MSSRPATVVLLVLLLSAGARAEERLWYVDVDVEGPRDALVLSVGEDGSTRVELELLAGERRRLAVPVPARSPLGASGLGRRPLPAVGGPDGGARVGVVGWSSDQPAAALERLSPALRARAVPPVAPARRHARAAELVVLVGAFGLVLALRRRPATGALAALASSVALAGLATRAAPAGAGTLVLEADLDAGQWVEVHAAAEQLQGPFASLQVLPDGPLAFASVATDPGRATWSARAPGRTLVGRRPLHPTAAPLSAADNRLGSFRSVWLRDAAGAWRALGAWAEGAPLPVLPGPAAPGAPDPPGWLGAHLPPGRPALVGELEDGRWVRASGFAVGG